MDSKFFEFWAEVFKNAAEGQRRMEDAFKWMNRGFEGFEDISAAFRKAYGLEEQKAKSPEYTEIWKQAADAFQKSMENWMSFCGIQAPGQKPELIEKYEALKKKAADQEETIRHLRMLLENERRDRGDLSQSFQNLITRQTEQFNEMMKGMGFSGREDES